MTQKEIFEQVQSGKLTAKAAVDELVLLGSDRADAEELVFIVLGGDDVVIKDAHDDETYEGSGKTKRELDQLMGDE